MLLESSYLPELADQRGRAGCNAMVAIIEEFDVSMEHGIPVVAMAGARLILDTGSPVSFARTGSITLGGCEHQVPVDCWAGGPDSLSELLGAPVDGLLGCDLLAGRILDLDCPAGRAHVISRDTSPATPCWLANAIALSFSTTKGVPVAQLSVNGQQVAAAIGTGAAVCFAAPSLFAATPIIGRHHNFHAAIGPFETDLHLVSIGLAGGASPVDVAVAAAPSALAPLLARLELQAILGGDLLMGSETLFDFRAESGVVLLSSPPIHEARIITEPFLRHGCNASSDPPTRAVILEQLTTGGCTAQSF